MCYIWEKDIAEWASSQNFPIIPCDLCGSQANLKRKRVRRLLDELEMEIPAVRNSMLTAMGNIVPSHLMDRNKFDFSALRADVGDVEAELDAALQ